MKSNYAKSFTHPEKEAVLKYIPLIYSKDSKLQKIENLEERKKQAAKQAGLEDLTILELKNKEVNKLIIDYLSEEFNLKFTLLITKLELLWTLIKKLREPMEDGEIADQVKLKGVLDEMCDRLEASCTKLIAEIYTSEMKDTAMEVVKMSLRPEERLVKPQNGVKK